MKRKTNKLNYMAIKKFKKIFLFLFHLLPIPALVSYQESFPLPVYLRLLHPHLFDI